LRPLSDLPVEAAQRLSGVIFDLDDTLLDHGELTEIAYSALFRLRDAGLRLVACTGRPAGWAEVVARQWPIDAAIGENGAVAYGRGEGGVVEGGVVEGDMEREAAAGFGEARKGNGGLANKAARLSRRERLFELANELLECFPLAALADDNNLRLTDVTIDIGEHRRVPSSDTLQMRAIARERGVRTLQSSVHLHLSLQALDKASGTVRVLRERFGEDPTRARSRYAFVGDSGNDAASFAAFSATFGVANVRAHLGRLPVPPRYVASAPMGRGFAEIAARLEALRTRAIPG
jgi:HAD superfamily hydrolase (TIGR01484 family)